MGAEVVRVVRPHPLHSSPSTPWVSPETAVESNILRRPGPDTSASGLEV